MGLTEIILVLVLVLRPFLAIAMTLTSFQVQTGSFLLRLFSTQKHHLLPSSLFPSLEAKTPKFFKWAQAVATHPSVNLPIYPEDTVIENFAAGIKAARATAA
jgi:glutathione S-transferase